MSKLFLSNEAISIAARDFSKVIIILGVKLVSTNIILQTICQNIIRPFRTCYMKYFTKSFLCYQQGSKSLNNAIFLQNRYLNILLFFLTNHRVCVLFA